jgi:HD superfamily phosphohydrolase
MEIRDPIHGTIELSKAETRIIDTEAFQRLRSIKQLGFAEFSFPGATHNRYLHSLGVSHLAGKAFDYVFESHQFSNPSVKNRMRSTLKLAALLHDIGHGPLSHASEEVMPPVSDLKMDIYIESGQDLNRRANHEDYTIKIITDSEVSKAIEQSYSDIRGKHVACLIDKSLKAQDDFFVDQGIDFRSILSQLISSELDCDRMDYLSRDSHFCGTSYGQIELNWLLSNLSLHLVEDRMHLALNRRALYTFDDFLISRHHMYLMVYFHHKAICYDEMLIRYLTDPNCTFRLPASVHEYLKHTDDLLYQHMRNDSNPWAQRIARKRPFKMLFELHETGDNPYPEEFKNRLYENRIEYIHSNSSSRLSKYHPSKNPADTPDIYVVDSYDNKQKPYRIEETTRIFQMYEDTRRIERVYVAPEDFDKAQSLR